MQKEPTHWTASVGECLKINIDGSFVQRACHGGWGFVVRDEMGRPRGAGAGRLNHLTSAAQAEAQTCAEAIQAAGGIGNVQFESDSQNLMKAVQSIEFDLALEGIIYRDIRSFVRLNFISAKFIFCPRTCNKVAHAMTALGASQTERQILWLESVPNCLRAGLTSPL
jgi:hypothetical protein